MVRYKCPNCKTINSYDVEPTRSVHLRNGIQCKHCNHVFFNLQKHTVSTPLMPLDTQLLPVTGTNNTQPSVTDLNNEVQQEIVYLKRYPDVIKDADNYDNDYYFTMKKSDWEKYKNLQDYNTIIQDPIYYDNIRTYQTFKRGDLANQFDEKAIQHYKKHGRRPPRNAFEY